MEGSKANHLEIYVRMYAYAPLLQINITLPYHRGERKTFGLWACRPGRMKKQPPYKSQSLPFTLGKNKRALCCFFYRCWNLGSDWRCEQETHSEWVAFVYLIVPW